MVWSLIIVVTLKYVVMLTRLDNKGEGGTLSLMALVQKTIGRRTPLLFLVAICSAGMFFGDALLTPAMSVLSAVEGLALIPQLTGKVDAFILPALGLAGGLFLLRQSDNLTSAVLAGVLIWCISLGALGSTIFSMARHFAVDPLCRVPPPQCSALVCIRLPVRTGAQRLCRRWAISPQADRFTCYVVFPCLALNYSSGAMVWSP